MLAPDQPHFALRVLLHLLDGEDQISVLRLMNSILMKMELQRSVLQDTALVRKISEYLNGLLWQHALPILEVFAGWESMAFKTAAAGITGDNDKMGMNVGAMLGGALKVQNQAVDGAAPTSTRRRKGTVMGLSFLGKENA